MLSFLSNILVCIGIIVVLDFLYHFINEKYIRKNKGSNDLDDMHFEKYKQIIAEIEENQEPSETHVLEMPTNEIPNEMTYEMKDELAEYMESLSTPMNIE